ncbi:glycosyltransferase family A protein [Vibrio sp. 10N.247.311.59]|uniref:glycosyltransferase family A protein n=1 Tax=Vibrio sp. 10N.247.311.59 TaxID=3229989 RepID=UPI00354AE565
MTQTLTIITPTFNRCNELKRLYDSLTRQDNYDFKWLIVDDGSVDGTNSFVDTIKNSDSFEIKYVFKKNGGKQSALNFGFDYIDTPWFFVVDSDDWLVTDTTNKIIETIKSSKNLIIYFHKALESGVLLGAKFTENTSTLKTFDKKGLKGEYSILYSSKLLIRLNESVEFVEYENEKYMAPSVMHRILTSSNNISCFNEVITICEYQPDGLTRNSVRNRYKSYNSTLYTYEILYLNSYGFKNKARHAINWWRFYFYKRCALRSKAPMLYLIPGYIMYNYDKIKNRGLF